MWYNVDMDTLSSMTLILAIATFILAGIAAYSIWQNYQLQKRERRERLLNEIIEWTMDIARSSKEIDVSGLYSQGIIDNRRGPLFLLANIMGSQLKLEAIRERSQYISKIALVFQQNLQVTIRTLIKDTEEHTKLLDECRDKGPGEIHSALTRVDAHDLLLHKSANKIIEEATKIKTRDID